MSIDSYFEVFGDKTLTKKEYQEGLKKIAEKDRKEIFEGIGENPAEVLLEKMEEFEKILKREKKEGQGKLKETINEIKNSPNGNEYFIDGSVAYLPPEGEAIFIGDIHGDAEAVMSIIKQTDFIEKSVIEGKKIFLVFLGDYADRGKKDIATIEEIINLKLCYPENVILLRGNHEEKETAEDYGLFASFIKKYQANSGKLFKKYIEAVKEMPGIVVAANGIVGVHGGIPNREITSLKSLQDEKTLEQMRWNDPTEETDERIDNNRDWNSGGFKSFGQKAFKRFMTAINGKIMIRSHEYPKNGWDLKFNDKLATIFSNGSKESISSGYYKNPERRVIEPRFLKVDIKNPKENFTSQDFEKISYLFVN